MAERHSSDGLTWPGGRIPDGHIVPNPPRPVPPPEPAPPVTYAERWWAALFIGLVLAAFVIGALR